MDYIYAHIFICMLSRFSCIRLCDPIDCSPPSSSVRGILQARILEWVTFPLPGDLLHPGIDPGFPALEVDSLPREPPDKPPLSSRKSYRA